MAPCYSHSMSTLIFDFDGTLAETLELTRQLFNKVAPKYHLTPLSEADLPKLRDKSAREVLKMSGLPFYKLPFLIRDVQKTFHRHARDVQPIPGIKPALTQLHSAGVTLGIVTSNSQENVEAFLDTHHIDCFDFIHSEKNLWGKGPVLAKVVKKMKLNPAETWYVGDEVRDIEAARTAGLKVIAVTWGFNSKKALSETKPDRLIEKPAQLLSVQ